MSSDFILDVVSPQGKSSKSPRGRHPSALLRLCLLYVFLASREEEEEALKAAGDGEGQKTCLLRLWVSSVGFSVRQGTVVLSRERCDYHYYKSLPVAINTSCRVIFWLLLDFLSVVRVCPPAATLIGREPGAGGRGGGAAERTKNTPLHEVL